MKHLPLTELSALADAGRVREVRAAHDDITDSAHHLLKRAAEARRDLNESEHREYQHLMDQANEVRKLIGRAQDKYAIIAASHSRNRGGASISDVQRVVRGEQRSIDLDVWSQFERRDLLTTTGNMIPTDVLQDIYLRLIQASGVLAAGPRIINTDPSGAPLRLNQFSSFSTAALVAEGSAIAESDPVVSSVLLGAYKYAFLTQFSHELVDDNVVNFQQAFATQASNAISNAIGAAYVTGSGTAQPEGIMTGATTGVTGGTGVAGAPTYANIISLYGSLPSQYRATSAFIMNSATFTALANLTDTTGRSLVLPSMVDGAPSTLLGRPLYLDNNLATFATAAKSIWFGSMQDYFVVRNAGPLRIRSSDDYALNQDLVTVRVDFRTDSKIVNTDAARVFVGGAS